MKNISYGTLFCLFLSLSPPTFPQGVGHPSVENPGGLTGWNSHPSLIGQYKAKVEEQGEIFTVVWHFRNDSSFAFDAKARKSPKSASKSMRGKWSLYGSNLLVHDARALVKDKWQEIPADSFSVSASSDSSITIDMHGKSVTLFKQLEKK